MLVSAHAPPGLRTETRATEQVLCSISLHSQNMDLGDNLADFGERSIFCLRKKFSFLLTGFGLREGMRHPGLFQGYCLPWIWTTTHSSLLIHYTLSCGKIHAVP